METEWPLPPKEVMSVMQWVLIQSRDMAPGALDWWTDPLSESMARSESELRELQRYVEYGWAFPRDALQLSPRSATLFLLRWLSVLPEPLLPALLVQDAHKTSSKRRRLLRNLPEMPRMVLLTVLAFFAQLSGRHGGRADFQARLVSAVTQQAPAPESASKLIAVLSEEVKAERRFPPLETIQAYAST
ncbi:unnamed protein product [Effrenium voratum]|nr:unnamed protein product [Effrenium voratum]